jgi:CPA2 family monovalent cation:H+ antiporter-2
MTLEIIAFTIYLAVVFNILLNKFKMPTIIWYIFTGILINFIFWLQDIVSEHEIKQIAEFWIVFLMFTIWLEFSIKMLFKMKKSVFLFWSLQFIISSIVFYFLLWIFFDVNIKELIILSLWLSLSSTAIVLKLLNESGEINKSYWKNTLWILIFQDLMVIPILLLITIFSNNNLPVWYLLSKTVLSWVFLIFILWVVWKYFLDYFLNHVAKTKSNEIFIWAILFIVIWSSAIAHFFWFSYTLWAFIAWMLISETHFKHQVEADLIPFRDILLWFFFVTVWIQLNFDVIFNNINFILVLLFVFIVIKILITYLVLWFFNKNTSSFKTALTLFQFWEFWIVVFELAWMNNLLTVSVSQIIVVVIILSMIITPFVLKNIDWISNFVFWNKNLKKHKELISWNLENHIILIWYGRLGHKLSELFEEKEEKYIILEHDIKTYKKAKKQWKPIIFWNAFQKNALRNLWIEKAKNIFVSVWKSNDLLLIISSIQKSNILWNIIVKVNNYKDEKALKELKVNNIIVETERTAVEMFWKVI